MATAPNNSVLRAIQLSNSGKRVPALDLVRSNPELAAMMSKARQSMQPAKHTIRGTREITTPDTGQLNNVANKTARNITEAQTVLQMLPDTELAFQILISSILSPKDMMTLELSYAAPAGVLPPTVSASVISVIKNHFDNVYKIKNKLPRILREILAEKGSYVAAVIPENAIDDMINRNTSISLEAYHDALGSNSSLMGNVGLLGPGLESNEQRKGAGLSNYMHGVGLESIDLHSYQMHNVSAAPTVGINVPSIHNRQMTEYIALEGIHITDNPNVLRMPALEEKIRRDQMNARLGFSKLSTGLESYGTSGSRQQKLDDRTLTQLIYKPRAQGWKEMQSFKTQNQLKRRSVGIPLIMELPSESVIPVYAPGQEEKHVGYFIMLDQTGNPIKVDNFKDTYQDLSNRFNFATTSQSTNLINRLKQLTEGFNCNSIEHLDRTVRIYGDMVEQDFLARLRNGVYANGVSIARNDDYYRVMLSRTLAQQNTTILFMPVEMVTYFAFKFNNYGIGVSLMDEMKILNNLRAITMFSNTMTGIKNSINRIGVDLNLDEDDPDPQKTIETMMHEIMKVNQNAFPLGVDAPADIVNYLQRAQYHFKISGHPGMPNTSAEFSETNSNYAKVDPELEESLERRAWMTMGLNKEIVDNGFNQETATSVVANNLMLSRRVMTIQDQFNPLLTDHHRKIIRADETLLAEIREELFNNYDQLDVDEEAIKKHVGQEVNVKNLVIDRILADFLEGLEISLPRPNTATLENQKESLNQYIELLDMAIDAYLSDEFFTEEIGGEISRSVDSIKKVLRAHFIRQYMAENGIMPEVASIVSLSDNNEPELDLWETQTEHIKKLAATLGNFIATIDRSKRDNDKLVQGLDAQADDNGGDFGGGDSGSDSGGDDPFGDSSGDDPFGGDGDGDGFGELDDDLDDDGDAPTDAPAADLDADTPPDDGAPTPP